ncbi:MAG: hypothetical protein LH702_08060 [Phormidesmis sp. CAN_BIN44]|nr:hypothetical protein [Phormidesmis sp. CAN_BIN44]
MTDDKTESSICIGTFDCSGIPIAVAKKNLSECAIVAFQTISLNRLIAHCLSLDLANVTYVHKKDGSSIKIERSLKGFTGHLGTPRSECR